MKESNLEDNTNLNQNQDDQDHSSDQDDSDSEITDPVDEEFFMSLVDISILNKICQKCSQIFSFSNLLHKHIQEKNCLRKIFIKISQSDQAHQSSQTATSKSTHSYFTSLETCKSSKDYKIHKQSISDQI